MEIKVKVEIGATNELTVILKKFAALMGGELGKQVTAEQAETPAEDDSQADKEAATAEAKEEPAMKDEPKAEKVEKTNKPSEVDVRKAIDECRKRFCGEDYKNNANTDEYKKYNKPLLAWFKYHAGLLGAEDNKPSNLPAESRAAFIEACENTILNDNDEFTLNNQF